jgi:AcrR family transcriptional regulator
MSAVTRPYRQVARAAATAEARHRIVRSFLGLLAEHAIEQVTLDEVAARAGSTRQTLIRYFGGKDGLMQALVEQIGLDVRARRNVPAGASVEQHMAALVRDYEEIGDVIVQLLAQEARLPSLRPFLDYGRTDHRGWIGSIFKPWLDGLAPELRGRRVDQLYAATDVNTWKLLRRDFGHSAETTASIIADMARRLVGALPTGEE